MEEIAEYSTVHLLVFYAPEKYTKYITHVRLPAGSYKYDTDSTVSSILVFKGDHRHY